MEAQIHQGNIYPDSLKAKDALQLYFSRYNFDNGGYHLKWFKIKLGPIMLTLPNIADRVAAVKIHDLHHLVTEYPASLRGEAEIGAWEIAAGCGRYYVAWLLNYGSMLYGMFFFTKPLLQAFLRGKRCRTSLYYDTVYNDDLLNRTIGELRESVGIHDGQTNRLTDYLFFLLHCMIALWPIWLGVMAILFICK